MLVNVFLRNSIITALKLLMTNEKILFQAKNQQRNNKNEFYLLFCD